MELLLKRPTLFAQLENEEAPPADEEEDLDEKEMSSEDLGTED